MSHFSSPSARTTLPRFLADQQRRVPSATGDFTGLLLQIALASKIIASRVRRAGLADVLGLTGDINVHGEAVQKLDIFAHRTLVSCVEASGHVCIMGSEEMEEPITLPEGYPKGKYVLSFDPLDGSGNIDINASLGTIFSIHRRKSSGSGAGELRDLLQPGRDIVAAGYVIYGSSNMFVYSAGHGVHGFTLDPSVGEFFLSHESIRIPERGSVYSVNEGNYRRWAPGIRAWVDSLKSDGPDGKARHTQRYIGAMVADIHQTLLRGGVFAYPADARNTQGKLRLLYEAAPMAYLVCAAGGAATSGESAVLDIEPQSLHQRTPLFLGSRVQVEEAMAFLQRGGQDSA